MLPAETKFSEFFLESHELNSCAVAVSGGSDSMALLHVANDWATSERRIVALTVDHGLRADSADEARQVAIWCLAMGIEHHILTWAGPKPSTGIQAKARCARYDLLTNWCSTHHVQALLTGHTADDQAETVAMRKLRSSSLKSVAGIWPERDWNGVQVLRPLLTLHRVQLRDYLRTKHQKWLEDPSNNDLRYERVRIRKTLAGVTHHFPAEAAAALLQVKATTQMAEKWFGANIDIHSTGFLTFPRKSFSVLAPDLKDDIILRAIQTCGGGKTQLRERFNLRQWLDGTESSRRTLGGAVFVKRKVDILIGREPARILHTPLVIPESGRAVWDKRFEISAPAGTEVVPAGCVESLTRRRDIPAFIQAGLPVVMAGNCVLAAPHLGIGTDVTSRNVGY